MLYLLIPIMAIMTLANSVFPKVKTNVKNRYDFSDTMYPGQQILVEYPDYPTCGGQSLTIGFEATDNDGNRVMVITAHQLMKGSPAFSIDRSTYLGNITKLDYTCDCAVVTLDPNAPKISNAIYSSSNKAWSVEKYATEKLIRHLILKEQPSGKRLETWQVTASGGKTGIKKGNIKGLAMYKDSSHMVMTDAPSEKGDSGGPSFLSMDGKPVLLGLISNSQIDENGKKYTIMTPIYFILDTLQLTSPYTKQDPTYAMRFDVRNHKKTKTLGFTGYNLRHINYTDQVLPLSENGLSMFNQIKNEAKRRAMIEKNKLTKGKNQTELESDPKDEL